MCSGVTPRTSGQTADGLHDEGRFVAFAAVRNGRQVRAIGFDQNAIFGRQAGGFAHRVGLGKCEHAAETQMESEVERLAGLRRRRR